MASSRYSMVMTKTIGPSCAPVKPDESVALPQKGARTVATPAKEAGKPSADKAGRSTGTTRRKAAGRRSKIPYTKDEIAAIFTRFQAARPEPKPELEYLNPFTLLVAVVLSAQATDAGVNKATRGLFTAADNAAAMVALGEDAIREHIRTIGLFRTKAKNVFALSRALVAGHGGEVPPDRESLEALAGVGRKTANVVLNTAFGEETLAVDTHIFRLGNRLKLAPGRTPEAVERNFLRIIPPAYRRHAHHWLILHGRYVCKARKPDCAACLIADICKADEKTNAVPPPGLTSIG